MLSTPPMDQVPKPSTPPPQNNPTPHRATANYSSLYTPITILIIVPPLQAVLSNISTTEVYISTNLQPLLWCSRALIIGQASQTNVNMC